MYWAEPRGNGRGENEIALRKIVARNINGKLLLPRLLCQKTKRKIKIESALLPLLEISESEDFSGGQSATVYDFIYVYGRIVLEE
jgi:hypothetical protein